MRTAFTHQMELGGGAGVRSGDFLALPDRPGVVVFFGEGDKAVLIATTASVRELARRRLLDEVIDGAESAEGAAAAPERAAAGESETPRPRRPSAAANLREIVRSVKCVEVGSAFEADAVYLELAREFLPHVYKVVAERWRAWFVHVDLEAEFPRFTKTNLSGGLVAPRSASTSIGGTDGTSVPLSVESQLGRGTLIGPFPDKDSAGRYIETVIDCFDLCRFHHVLVQAPRGVACAYKELGRCPAPCDGSETMQSFRERVREAAGCAPGAGVSLTQLKTALSEEMKVAAAGGEFEAAARGRDRLKRLEGLGHRSFAQAREIGECRWVVVQRSPEKGRVRVFLADAFGLVRCGDFDPTEAAACAQIAERSEGWFGRDRGSSPVLAVDTLGLVTRHLFMAEGRRGGVCLPASNASPGAIAESIERVLRVRSKPEAIEDREIGEE